VVVDDRLLELTRELLDVKNEKKEYDKEANQRIKKLEEQIKQEVRTDTVSMELK
jgi:hypothetical protein